MKIMFENKDRNDLIKSFDSELIALIKNKVRSAIDKKIDLEIMNIVEKKIKNLSSTTINDKVEQIIKKILYRVVIEHLNKVFLIEEKSCYGLNLTPKEEFKKEVLDLLTNKLKTEFNTTKIKELIKEKIMEKL